MGSENDCFVMSVVWFYTSEINKTLVLWRPKTKNFFLYLNKLCPKLEDESDDEFVDHLS